MDNDEIAEEYCGSSASDRFGIALNQARQSERAEIVEMLENLDKGDAVYIDDKTYYPYIRVNWSVIIQKIKEMDKNQAGTTGNKFNP